MIKIGTDFTGIGSVNQALKRLNIPFKEVFACEMDKYARQTYIHNYGEPEYYPKDVYEREIPTHPLDIYVTTPPCQSFSLAGKRKGEEDKRGVLFYNSHEFIQVNKPRYFCFENVKGLLSDDSGKTFARWIDLLGGKSVNGNPVIFPHEESVPYHVYYQVLNAKDYGVPQNRERIFIIGIRDDADNNFSFPKPFELKKRLKDVLEENVDEKYYLSEKMIEGFTHHKERHKVKETGFQWQPKTYEDIANCLRANAGLCPTDNTIIVVGDLNKGGERGVVYSENSKIMSCLTATDYKQPKQVAVIEQRARGYNKGNTFELSPSITCNSWQENNFLVEFPEVINPLKDKTKYGWHFEQQVYDENGITRTVKAGGGSGNNPKLLKDFKIRKLTPRECFRLMDFPDDFTWPVSDSQAYKQAGNSVVVKMWELIFTKLFLK